MQFGELQGQSALTLIKSAAESTQTTQTPAVENNLQSPEPVQSDHIIDIRV